MIIRLKIETMINAIIFPQKRFDFKEGG